MYIISCELVLVNRKDKDCEEYILKKMRVYSRIKVLL